MGSNISNNNPMSIEEYQQSKEKKAIAIEQRGKDNYTQVISKIDKTLKTKLIEDINKTIKNLLKEKFVDMRIPIPRDWFENHIYYEDISNHIQGILSDIEKEYTQIGYSIQLKHSMQYIDYSRFICIVIRITLP
jgi:hypothetical protein